MPYRGLMPRDTLTREQIVSAAIDLLDAEGLEGLNMRALGQRLGSAATSVYWHVGSKDNLIALAADRGGLADQKARPGQRRRRVARGQLRVRPAGHPRRPEGQAGQP